MSTEGPRVRPGQQGAAEAEAGARLAALSGERKRLLQRLLRERQSAGGAAPVGRRSAGGPVRLPDGGDRPLSPGQLGLWLACEATPESAAYHMPGVLRLKGPLSIPHLAAALDGVVARHEALRTRVVVAEGTPVQRVAPPASVPLPVCDLSRLPADRGRRLGDVLAARLTRLPFDLAAGQPVRAAALRLAPSDHRLVLTVHHVVADRWSMGVVMEDLAALYRPGEGGEPTRELGEPALHLGDHAVWQRQRLKAGEFADDVEFWRRALEAVPHDLELPVDRSRPDRPTGRGGRLSQPLIETAVVSRLAASVGATPFMVLLAALGGFLQRLTGRRRMVLGTPVAGRQRADLWRVVGHLVDVLPLPLEVASTESFTALVARARRLCLDAFAHQEVPFHHLVETLRPSRTGGGHPFFQMLFSYQDLEVAVDGFRELTVELLPVDTASAQLDLTLMVRRQSEMLIADWEYSADLFDASSVGELAASFAAFVEAAVTDPRRPLHRLPLLTAEQRRRLVAEPPRGVEGAMVTVHGLVEEAARRSPEAVALEMARGTGAGAAAWTYRRLDAEADRLARRLIDAGVGPESRVGLAVERSPEMVAGLLAVLKSGAAVVPLDPAYPPDRLAWMVADAGLAPVLCDAVGADALPPGPTPRVRVEEGETRVAEGPLPVVHPESLAYVIYTSGSTGRPKGVAVSHGVAAEHFAAWARRFALGPEDAVYQFATLSFDAGLEQILPTLCAGARLVLRGPEPPAPEELARQAEADGLTVLYLPAAYWQAMTRTWAEGEVGPGRLRLVNPGGDVMAPEAVRRWASSALAGVPLLNGYGPTEAVVTTASCVVPVERWSGKAAGMAGRVPIGEPVHGRRVYVLGRDGELLPPGVPGELHVGGRFLARGYLGQAARTAAAFVPDPHSFLPGGRLYRTGDLVRHLPDGGLDFVGRIDHQVKVRGFRIELGEVESALEELSAVARAVVAAPADASGQRRLVGYVVPAQPDDGGWSPEALQRGLAGRLPEYMVPTSWVRLERLPLSPNGKIDREALPEPPSLESGVAADRVPPEGRREELLARLWAEALGVPEVGARDNFFALGGDSILSLRIISRAHSAGLRLTPSLFFRYPTVAELAAAGEAVVESAPERPAAHGEAPPTPIQRWFFERRFRQPHHWNQGQAFTLGQPLRPSTLRPAVTAVWQHHEALRSRFERVHSVATETGPTGGFAVHPGAPRGWRQVIDSPAEFAAHGGPAVATVDLTALPEARRGAAGEAVGAAAQGALHFAAGPLSRAVLLLDAAVPTQRQRLLLVFHHLVMDGVSWRLILEDLAAAFAALERGSSPTLPPRTSSLVEWGRRLAEAAESGLFEDEREHWLAAVPRDGEGIPAGRTGDVATSRRVVYELGEEATRRLLQDAPEAYRTQVNDLLLTALAQAIAPRFGAASGDLVVELEGHGREGLPERSGVGGSVDLSRTVGWLTSKYPVRLPLCSVADVDDPAEVIPAVKEALRAVPGRGLGYGVLRHLRESPETAPLAAAAAPAVTFNYLGRMDPPQGLAWPILPSLGAAGPEVGRDNQRASALEVVGLVLDGRLHLIWDHDTRLHDSGEIDAMAGACLRGLSALIEHCTGRGQALHTPSDFPLARLDGAGLERLREAVPALADAYPMSAVQEGMLFHSLSAPDSGVYVEQLILELHGPLDATALRTAWEEVVARHAVLRTAFVWEGLARPLQAVSARIDLPWHELDWSLLGASERDRRLDQLLAADRRRGFDVGRAPLMRFHLIREDAERHRLVWCNHHLLVDGWTEPMVLDEVFTLYPAGVGEGVAELPVRRPYRDYIAWLERGDGGAAEAFWRQALGELDAPTLLPPDPAARAGAPGHGEEEMLLAAELSGRLEALCRTVGLTVSTLVQGAWALLLGTYTGRRDVVAGITVSGRPAELPGVDGMVGMFINTLPLRARLEPEAEVVAWLRCLQRHTGEILQHESTPLVDIQAWSGLPRAEALFNTIVVCMNLPREETALSRPAAGLRLERAYGIEQTNYPLTVTARPGERLLLQINHQLGSHTQAHARAVLAHFEALFTALADQPGLTVGAVAKVVATTDRLRDDAAARRHREQRHKAFAGLKRRAPRRASAVSSPDHPAEVKEALS